MKVLHLISGGDTGGAKTHLLSLLSELKTTEDVCLVCLSEGVMSREAEAKDIPCTVLSGGFFREKRAVYRMLRHADTAVLHCHGARANLTGALLRPRLSLPVISTVHSDPRLDYLHRPLAGLVFGGLNRFALGQMDALVCVSDAMRETLAARGMPRRKLFTIYNGPDMRTAPRKEAGRAWLEARGIRAPEDAVFVGCAARFDRVKDLPTLLRGFALAAKACPRLYLILAGEGREEAALQSLAEELSVAERVFFPGWITDMDGYYAALHINALSSLSETFPYALSEGARYSLPVAATAVGGIPTMLDHGRAGYLFAPGDAETLARALTALGESEELRSSLGEAFRCRVEENFSLAAMGKRQIAIYREVLTPRRGLVLSGACGQGNPGDEAMLSAMVQTIRTAAGETPVTVLSRRPRETGRLYGVDAVHALDFPGIRRALRRSQRLIAGGGNLYQDYTSRRSLCYYLHMLTLARRCGCGVTVFGCGLGPLSSEGLKRTVETLNATADTVVWRDGESLALAKNAGLTVPEVHLSADAALALPRADEAAVARAREKFALSPEKEYIVLVLRPWQNGREKARMLVESARRFGASTGREVILLPLCRKKDAAFARRVACGCRVLPSPETPEEAMALLGGAGAVLSQRLHALVFARIMGVPAAGIACDGRIRSFLQRELREELSAVDGTTAERLLKIALSRPAAADGERLDIGLEILKREAMPFD